MTWGLIGYTGFVGSNLDRQTAFDGRYNSANVADMRRRGFDGVVCAGVSAAKWLANRDPDGDRRQIDGLTDVLRDLKVREFILISTIDVYPAPERGGDEDTPIDEAGHHAYGRHRRELEQWCLAAFPLCRIVRLPALFGQGLKKNALYDLIHGNQVGGINPAGQFQWYAVDRLWTDIQIARRADLRLINLFTEPLPMNRIVSLLFPSAMVGAPREPAPVYRVGTRHAELFGGSGRYIETADSCLARIADYVAGELGDAQ